MDLTEWQRQVKRQERMANAVMLIFVAIATLGMVVAIFKLGR